MSIKAKAKPPAPAKPVRAAKAPAAANPLRQADSRWQRTKRYGWDKGGAQGGRKS
jgi:hypothetical protein